MEWCSYSKLARKLSPMFCREPNSFLLNWRLITKIMTITGVVLLCHFLLLLLLAFSCICVQTLQAMQQLFFFFFLLSCNWFGERVSSRCFAILLSSAFDKCMSCLQTLWWVVFDLLPCSRNEHRRLGHGASLLCMQRKTSGLHLGDRIH